MISIRFFLLIFLCCSVFVHAQDKNKGKGEGVGFQPAEKVTQTSSVKIDGKSVQYTVEAGYLTLQTDYGKKEAHVFYIAYTKNDVQDITQRPLTFSFNGGPGSSSVWLHLGMLGPRKIKMSPEGEPPAPPYELVDNHNSWLDKTDMVFIDPVSTGYSRADEKKKADKFHGYSNDIKSVGDFIRRYLADQKRWGSPKYIIGESYGTIRAAGLSNHLLDEYGIYLNGMIMVSFVNNFQTIKFREGNDLPYKLFLPAYTASAWYHEQLPQELQQQPLTKVLDKAENFASDRYSKALFKGQTLSGEEKQAVVEQYARYTGLDERFINQADLRVNSSQFRKQLLKDSLEITGRFDSRYTSKDINALSNYPQKDPSYHPTVHGPFSTLINDYLTRELGFNTKVVYEVLSDRVWPWNYKPYVNEYLNVTTDLTEAMVKNPDMKVWVANGYYDLATPYFATQYTINHMNISDEIRDNMQLTFHKAGHMMYVHKPSLEEMKQQAIQFYE